MITPETVAGLSKEEIPGKAMSLGKDDLPVLFELLNEKDDNLRYHALLLL